MRISLCAVLAVSIILSAGGCASPSRPTGSATVIAPASNQHEELTFALGSELDLHIKPVFETTLTSSADWQLEGDDPSDGLNVLWHTPTQCRLVLYQATTDGMTWDLSSDERASRRAIEDYMLTVLAEPPADIPIYATGVAQAVTFGAVRRSAQNELVTARTFTELGVYLMLIVGCPSATDPIEFYSAQVYPFVSVALVEA